MGKGWVGVSRCGKGWRQASSVVKGMGVKGIETPQRRFKLIHR